MNSEKELHTAIHNTLHVDLRGAEPTIRAICAKADAYEQMRMTMNTIKVIAGNPIGSNDFEHIHAIAVVALKSEP